MMGLGEIVRLNAQATNRARKAKTVPVIVNAMVAAEMAKGNLETSGIWFPHLGDHVPKGWRTFGARMFCDMTGIDLSGPARSFGSLARHIAASYEHSPRHGWATTEQGQFQTYVQEYAPLNCTCSRCVGATLSA